MKKSEKVGLKFPDKVKAALMQESANFQNQYVEELEAVPKGIKDNLDDKKAKDLIKNIVGKLLYPKVGTNCYIVTRYRYSLLVTITLLLMPLL